MPAAVETMAYRGDKGTPWHGIGNVLTGEESFEEAFVSTGMNYTVAVRELFNEHGKPNPYKRESYRVGELPTDWTESEWKQWRDENGYQPEDEIPTWEFDVPLGGVGPDWTPLQNIDAFNAFQPFIDDGSLVLDTAGVLHGGRRIWVLAEIANETQEAQKNDPVKPYLLLSQGHDGLLGVHFGFTPIRVVCSNTEAMARQDKRSELIKFRHTSKVKENVETVAKTLDLYNRQFVATMEVFQDLAKREISKESLRKYVRIAWLDSKQLKEKELPTRTRNILARIEELFETGRGHDIGAASFWRAYNAVTEYVNHEVGKGRDKEKGTASDSSVESLMWGNSKLKLEKALRAAMLLAEKPEAPELEIATAIAGK